MSVREQFVEELENSLEKSFSKARENAPQFILLEKEPGATVSILENALRDIIMADDNRIWRADAAESIVPMFEQLLPESLKEIMRVDKPPRIELGLISNKAGMNMGTVQRGDSSLDPDIISAMMEAVRNFVKDSLSMHAGSEIVEKGIERFEMHGYTIMVCTGEIIGLTLILSGSIDKSLIKEMQRVTKLIEDKYGSILEDWKGAMSELGGIEAPVSRTFFTSKKYEGEWDLDQLKLLQARMFDETLRIIESTAGDRELVLLIENIDLADQSSTEQLKYIVRNLDDEKILFILTFNLAKDEGILQDPESLLESIDPYSPVRLRQKMDYDAGEKLTELFPDNLDMALFTLSHSVLLGSVDEHMISKSSGRSEEEVRAILETLRANNLVTGNLDGYLSNFVLGQLSEEKRFEITNEVVRSLEADRPSEILRIGELFIWLAGLDAEFSARASDYARKIAEHHTRSFNLQGAIDMWLKAYMHERNQDSRMEDLVNIIKFEWLLSNVDEMKYYVDELLGMAESSGNKYYSGFALWNLARYCVRKGMFEEAIRYCDEADSCFKELGDLEHQAFVLNSKSTVYTHLGNRDKSLELQKEVLEVADTLNNDMLRARALANIGQTYTMKGEHDTAEITLKESLAVSESIGVHIDKPAILWNLGLLYYYKNDWEASLDYCDRSLSEARAMSNWKFAIHALTTKSAALDKLEKYEESIKCSFEAYELSKRTEAGDTLALTYNIFEAYFRKQLDWLEKTTEVIKSPKAGKNSKKELKIELLDLFSEQLALISKLVDGTGKPEQKAKVSAQLREIDEKLSTNR